MTTYGQASRISVEIVGGGIGAIEIDTEKKTLIFARGDPASGTVSVNDPTQVSGPGELDDTFGADTEIVEYFRQAAGNGVGYGYLYGVVPATTSVTGEAHSSTQNFTLGNVPIIEDYAEITITDLTNAHDLTIEWRYGDPTTLSPPADTAYVNPFSGVVQTDESVDYEADYKYHEWQNAFDSATDVVREGELGHWILGTESEDVMADAVTTIQPLRESQWKMIHLTGPVEPNATTSDGDADLDVGTYGDGIDADATFYVGPTRLLDQNLTAIGAAGGIMAGNSIRDPIIGDSFEGITDLETVLTVPQQEDLEDNLQVIPVSDVGSPKFEGNVSTSTETDWTRTYFARRLADRLLLLAREVARAVRGRLNNEKTETIVEEEIADQIIELIDDGVVRPNTEDETRWFVDAEQDTSDPQELDVSFGFTPVGVVDSVEITETVNF